MCVAHTIVFFLQYELLITNLATKTRSHRRDLAGLPHYSLLFVRSSRFHFTHLT